MELVERESPLPVGSSLGRYILGPYRASQFSSVELRSSQAIVTFHFPKFPPLDQLNAILEHFDCAINVFSKKPLYKLDTKKIKSIMNIY